GQVPIGISRLNNLVSLDLSSYGESFLELRDPDFGALLQGLSNLRVLYLDNMNISASGEEWSGALARSTPELQELSLAYCSLSGDIGISLSKLRSLSVIDLELNSLNTTVPDFFVNFSSLSVLWLGYCGLEGFFPKDIFQLKNLTIVDVSNNPMLSGSLPDFTMDSALESLMLSRSNFSWVLPDTIGNLKSLKILDLSHCHFYGKIPSSIWNLTQLMNLYLFSNNFSGLIPPFQSSLSPTDYEVRGLQKLTELNLHSNSLSGPIPQTIFNLPQLQTLLLPKNQLSGQLPEFSEASLLKHIDLSNNQLQGKIPMSLFRLSELVKFSLANNNFNGFFQLNSILLLKKLSYLDLSDSGLSCLEEDDRSSFSSFPKIATLYLVGCNLTKIPLFLMFQDQITTLDLSRNSITGNIPIWISNVGNGNLNYLNLSCNLFTYVEGPSLNFSSVFMVLDLHSNNLQGPIPLPPPNPFSLDYSYNKFSSSIPNNLSLYLNSTLRNPPFTLQCNSSICS
ncbi:receptor-like protein 7, partial [Dendrobium catenatum]|uniref:receptor-like protein 7 n=1 Tax=Dendrobium catenatum TaxID=906689 RepID=UPI00109FF9EE